MGGNYSKVSKKSRNTPITSTVKMPRNAATPARVGNMALSAAAGIPQKTARSIDELGASLHQRLGGVQQRPQAQIPRAENEADRLSAAVSVGTPESVKSVMGRRMGADFSGVRFHTGAAAAAKADAMGARAYTSGADVYFGSGGFDASVAAHELVHTAQQGMVDSSASVMATPVGGVQMWPWSKKKSKVDVFAPFVPDKKLEKLTDLATIIGGGPQYDEEELQQELDNLREDEEDGEGGSPETAQQDGAQEIDDVSIEDFERENADEIEAYDPIEALRENFKSQMEMQVDPQVLKEAEKEAKKRLKKNEKKFQIMSKQAMREMAKMEKQDEQLAQMKELPDLIGVEEELDALGNEDAADTADFNEEDAMAELEQMLAAEEAQQSAKPAKKKKGFFRRMVGGIKSFGRKVWSKTGGRAIRKHHDALLELHEAIKGGTWAQLTPEEQEQWRKKNRVAYRRYMNSDDVRRATENRSIKRQNELAAAEAFFRDHQDELGRSSMLTPDATAAGSGGSAGAGGSSGAGGSGGTSAASATGNRFTIGHGKADAAGASESATLDEKLGKLTDTVDKVTIPPSLLSSMQEAKVIGDKTAGPINGALAGANMATGGIGMYLSGKEMKEAFAGTDNMAKVDATVGMIGNASKTANGMSSVAKLAGATKNGGAAMAATDLISGAVDAYKGARQIYQGSKKHDAMEQFQRDYFGPYEREMLANHELILKDISTQGKMEGTRQKIKGAGKVVTGAVDAVAGAAELSGVGSAVGLGLKAGNLALKAGFAGANHIQKERMKDKVVEQTTGLTDEKIREFQKLYKIEDFSRAKQALMKAKGYESGTRAELYADQTEKRGQYLAALANSGAEGDKANQLVAGLGVEKKSGAYDAGDISKSLGLGKSRTKIIEKYNTIKKLFGRR